MSKFSLKVRSTVSSSLPFLICAALLGAPSIARATDYFVSPSGNDSNSGTIGLPLRTIAAGVSKLQAGDTLNLRQGIYVGPLLIDGKQGTETQPIAIRSYQGEHAYIDGTLAAFRKLEPDQWYRAKPHDPAAHEDEYISQATFTQSEDDPVNRGAFLDHNPYTRLISYSKLKDFRSKNETFDKIPDPDCDTASPDPDGPDPTRPGRCVTDKNGVPQGYRLPWVYMGPGLFFNKETGKVHIRLSHTHNNIVGLPDYTGDVDPNNVRLAISNKAMTTLHVRNSKHVRFENLSVRFGGEYTVYLQGVTGFAFDHVRIFSSSYGVRMGTTNANPINANTLFSHCEFKGGMPTWYFRTDRKSEYFFKDGGTIVENSLGKQTLRALLLGNNKDIGTEIHHCEFANAHDMYLIGTNVAFHHNWINNLNDEGMFLDGGLVDNLRIYENVITKTLSPISFAGECPKDPVDPVCELKVIGGPRYIYRNLIDLRSPTAGIRPRRPGDTNVWRYGNTFKSGAPDGPYDLFHNTFLVYKQSGQASYLHYRDTSGTQARRSFNNMFIAVNPDAESDRPITFVPSPNFPAATDGNNYFRIGANKTPLLRYIGYEFEGHEYGMQGGANAAFTNLQQYRSCPAEKPLYCHSHYEAESISLNPSFRRIGADWRFRTTDDLRLGDGSTAIGAGVPLPPDLAALDPYPPTGRNPDIGCYRLNSEPLRVGVDERRSYPAQ